MFGEVDFCVLGPTGKLLVIEQKNGALLEKNGGLFKAYSTKEKNVGSQIHRSLDGIRTKFQRAHPGTSLILDYLLYCPEHRVQKLDAVGLDRDHIVDATRFRDLPRIVAQLADADAPRDDIRRDTVRSFLLDTWQLFPDVTAFMDIASKSYSQLSGGLTTWVQRLHLSPFRLRVDGTAGSGKTQLAMAMYRRAIDAGQNPLYVCFNNALAAHIARIVPAGGRVCTFHALCSDWIRHFDGQPDFTDQDPDFWGRMARWALRLKVPEGWMTECLIVDEGQDMEPEWKDVLFRLTTPAASILWLEDPLQNLYARPVVELPDFARLDAPVNYRTPWQIHSATEFLLDVRTESGNPLPGMEVDIRAFASEEDLLAQTEAVVENLLRLGFRTSDIAIVSYAGRARSLFTCRAQLGRFGLSGWTGTYDADNHPVFTEGDIAVETVHRFKGQQAPAVIFVEIDFAAYKEDVRRRLFCGMTRASVALTLLMTTRANTVLTAAITERSSESPV